MGGMAAAIIEGTITLVMAYLILVHAQGFSAAVSAIGEVYVGAVKALQGPAPAQ